MQINNVERKHNVSRLFVYFDLSASGKNSCYNCYIARQIIMLSGPREFITSSCRPHSGGIKDN